MTIEERPVTAPIRPAKKQDRATLALLLIAAMIAIGGVMFAVGRATAGSGGTAANNSGNRGGFAGRAFPSLAPGQTLNPGQFGNRGLGLGGVVSGTVQSIGPDSMTITLASGSTVTVDLSGTTTYHSETAASATDVAVGSTVQVTINTGSSGASPGASPSPGASGTTTFTAKDILIVTP
jgi:hypothetical protein